MIRCILILNIILLYSCGKTHRISKEDKEFNPYTEGNMLIFKSDIDQIDTIVIKEIYKSRSSKEYLPSLHDTYYENLSVKVSHTAQNNDSLNTSFAGSILHMSNYGDGAMLTFWFTGIKKWASISKGFKVGELRNLDRTTLVTDAGEFHDVVILESDIIYPSNDWDMINKVYWSINEGYVKLEINHKKVWTLIKKE